MKSRWLVYVALGTLFGITDFYYPSLLPHLAVHSAVIGFLLTFGVWLLPAVPVCIYEANASKSKLRASLTNVLIWCVSVMVYYLTNVIQLAVGSPAQPNLGLSNRSAQFFWQNWRSELSTYILPSTLEWIMVAIVSGFIIGFVVSFIYLFVRELGTN